MINSISQLRERISPLNQVKIITIIFFVFILFFPVLLKLIHLWSGDADYSHGFFVIPISLYMVWQKRERLLSIEIKPTWAGFILLGLGLVCYYVALVASFNTLQNISMLAVFIGLLLFFCGIKFTRELLCPIFFLFFMFPIPSAYYIMITNPLKLMITMISAAIIGFMGIPVFRDGNLLFFANTQLEVAEACSGVRSLYSYLMLGFLFALLSIRLRTKILLILSTIPLAILVNIVRVTITGVLSNFYGPKIAQGFFHEFTGFVLFIIGFIILVIEYYIFNYRSVIDSANA